MFLSKFFFDFIDGENFEGYEIHNGESEIGENSASILVKKAFDFESRSESDFCGKNQEKSGGFEAKGAVFGNAAGTYIHGFFDGTLAFSLAQKIALQKGSDLRNLESSKFSEKSFRDFKESQYNLLADEIRKNLDMDAIYKMLSEAKV